MSAQLLTQIHSSEKRAQRPFLVAQPTLPSRAAVHPLVHLQRSVGNHAIAGLIQARRLGAETGFVIQPKVVVGPAHDHYEQEADAVAHRVMAMPAPTGPGSVQRQVMPDEKEKEKTFQTKPLASSITPLVQRQAMAEEEEKKPVQAKHLAASITPFVQRQTVPEEDKEKKPVQTRRLATSITPLVQREMIPEDDKEKKPVQAKSLTDSGRLTLQREMGTEEDKEKKEQPIQAKPSIQRAAAGESFQAGEGRRNPLDAK